MIRLNTHDRTPCPKMSKFLIAMFAIGVGGMYFSLLMGSFLCFYYAESVVGGILMIILPTVLIAWILIRIRNISKAYVEIDGETIRVVDYYWGFKKEQIFSFSDITSGEIVLGGSLKVKGYSVGMRYIIFKKDGKYLFKIIYLPETERVFKRFLQDKSMEIPNEQI